MVGGIHAVAGKSGRQKKPFPGIGQAGKWKYFPRGRDAKEKPMGRDAAGSPERAGVARAFVSSARCPPLAARDGNPPFVGKKEQARAQKGDLMAVWGEAKGAGLLDYVTGWYKKASDYIGDQRIAVAFVSPWQKTTPQSECQSSLQVRNWTMTDFCTAELVKDQPSRSKCHNQEAKALAHYGEWVG